MEAITRKTFFYNLYKIGYSYQQILMIMKQEVIFFYSILLGLPMIVIIISITQAYLHQDISLLFIMMILGVQFITGIIAGIFTYISYKNNILQVLKEGIRYE